MAAVSAKELFFLYRAPSGDAPALRGLSVEVDYGEVVSVVGPSGSGKTTLLSLCAGLARPSSGELAILGESIERAPAGYLDALRRRAIGIVRQHYHLALPRELTAVETVALPLRLLGERAR
ncbi:MAG: ATP-binding cassette domain-containing protein, partial [Actinomycetota bacterium]|nr:ATP-binding cassette domain-containing protein [Actinomycetota bacterium]